MLNFMIDSAGLQGVLQGLADICNDRGEAIARRHPQQPEPILKAPADDAHYPDLTAVFEQEQKCAK